MGGHFMAPHPILAHANGGSVLARAASTSAISTTSTDTTHAMSGASGAFASGSGTGSGPAFARPISATFR
jgi:hypothetical protein